MQSVFGKKNYGGLKHNSLYLGQAIWWVTEPHSIDWWWNTFCTVGLKWSWHIQNQVQFSTDLFKDRAHNLDVNEWLDSIGQSSWSKGISETTSKHPNPCSICMQLLWRHQLKIMSCAKNNVGKKLKQIKTKCVDNSCIEL